MRLSFVFATLCLLFAGPAAANTHSEAGAMMPKPIQKGPAHAMFTDMAGTWNITQTMFMPDGKKMEAKGTQTVRTILGGLGMAFETNTPMGPMTMAGYGSSFWVPAKKQYQSIWFDNMSQHGMWTSWGTWDEKTKTMTQVTKGPDPNTGKETSMKMVTVVKDKDNYMTTFTMAIPGGKEMTVMTMAYTRAK
jgi:hypothetical protein